MDGFGEGGGGGRKQGGCKLPLQRMPALVRKPCQARSSRTNQKICVKLYMP